MISGLLLIGAVFFVFWLDARVAVVQISGARQPRFMGVQALPPGLVLAAALLVVMPLAVAELRAIFLAKGIATSGWVTGAAAGCAALIFYGAFLWPDPQGVLATIATLLAVSVAAAFTWHARRAQVEGAAACAGVTVLAVVYLGLLGGFYLAMRQEHSAWVVLAVILVIKASDIGAYAAGKTLGRHKLIAWLSPGKTWEGLVGGVALSMIAALAFAWLGQRFAVLTVTQQSMDGEWVSAARRYSLSLAAWGGAVVALMGVAGGMLMSLLKRDAGIKDSGHSIPGMGGVLDVLDSLLLAGPAAYWILKLAA
jgi:phosphatidate cytidylyltransferase